MIYALNTTAEILAGLRVLIVLFLIHFQNRTGTRIPKTRIRISYLLSSFLGQEFKQEETVAGIALPTWTWTTAWRKSVPTFIFLNPSALLQSQLLVKPAVMSYSVAVDNWLTTQHTISLSLGWITGYCGRETYPCYPRCGQSWSSMFTFPVRKMVKMFGKRWSTDWVV